MKTFYVGHDQEYQRRLAAGNIGWDGGDDEYAPRFREIDEILTLGHAPTSGRLLELGCGCGNMGLWFAAKGYDVHGMDVSATAVAKANEDASASGLSASFRVGNVVELPGHEDAHYDFVFDSHLIHCIIGNDRKSLFGNIRRVLRPGGYLLVTTMVYGPNTSDLKGYDEATGYTISQIDGDAIATRYIGKCEDILAELTAAGFDVIRHEVQTGEGHEDHPQLVIEARKQ